MRYFWKKMLPAGLLLVLEGFLGVIGGAGRVFYRTLNVRINPGQSKLKFKLSKTNTCSPSRLGFPRERRCPWTFRAAPWSTAPAWWTSHACQTDGLVIKKSAPLLDVVDGRSQLIFVSLNLDMPGQSRSSPSLEIIRGWSFCGKQQFLGWQIQSYCGFCTASFSTTKLI